MRARAGREFSGAEKTANDIRALKIQGARRIAQAAVVALSEGAQKSKAKNYGEFYSDLAVAADELASARATEPMLRNYLEDLLSVVRAKRESGVARIKKELAGRQKEILESMEHSQARISYYGAQAMPEDGAVLVHCHSTTLMSILKLAKKQGKKLRVFCTETRPKYQGRVSALELANAGLDVTLIVDSAAAITIEREGVKVVLFGADAITERGELLNKIGTCQIALAAKRHGAKVYSAAELHKFDPKTAGGRMEEIEEREGLELADDLRMLAAFKKAGVKIRNMAFDATPPELIDAYITEEGLLEPKRVAEAARQRMAE